MLRTPSWPGISGFSMMSIFTIDTWSGEFLADLFERGGDHLARPAPVGPEIDHHRRVGIEDVVGEAGIGDGFGSHGESP